jgi:hypothetical protein
MPSLRGHHLICLHFFDGEGYDQRFIENLETTLEKIGSSSVNVCSGADDICRECLYLKQNTCSYDENAEKEVTGMDHRALYLLKFSVGREAGWEQIKRMLPQVFSQWYEVCCSECQWLNVCSKNEFFRKLLSGRSYVF